MKPYKIKWVAKDVHYYLRVMSLMLYTQLLGVKLLSIVAK